MILTHISLLTRTHRCRCGAEFCYVCGSKWKTCRCVQTDPRRLYDPIPGQEGAARPQVHGRRLFEPRSGPKPQDPHAWDPIPWDTAGPPAPPPPLPRQTIHRPEVCGPDTWDRITCTDVCDMCRGVLRGFIYRCRACRSSRCRRCMS